MQDNLTALETWASRWLEKFGITLNNSRGANRIAINLLKVAKLAMLRKLPIPTMAVLRKSIIESRTPQCQQPPKP
ncbi:hypothetical protein [Undibacterium sp. YM2]|uniref:hypothetical protein n=1 Tax=Undibacterium sp. YM2 TaxID=2058625 RepID=UPI001389874A|nr:hypothetical protein [Undibacterium sp. YM2]